MSKFVELHDVEEGNPVLFELTGLVIFPALKEIGGSRIFSAAYGRLFNVKESYSQIRKMIYGES